MGEDFDCGALISAGDLRPIVDWLTEKIFKHSSMYDPEELFEMCCGAPFDPKYYMDYLEGKYTALYDL